MNGKRVVVARAADLGSEARAHKTASALSHLGLEVHALSWPRGAGRIPVDEPAIRVRYANIPALHGAGLRNAWPLVRWNCWLLRSILGLRRLHAVHAVDLDTGWSSFWAARMSGAKFVYDVADFYGVSRFPNGPASLARAAHRLELWLASKADAVLIPHECRQVLLGGVKPKRLIITHNTPVVSELPARNPSPQPTALYVGVMSLRRGVADLVKAALRRPDWRVVLGGHGEDEPQVRELAAQAPNVEFIGRQPYFEVLRRTAEAHILPALYDPAMPNHKLSAPNKVYEAMMCGIPSLVAESTGVDEMVREHGLGYVIPYGDVDALVEVLDLVRAQTDSEKEAFAQRVQEVYTSQYSGEVMRGRLFGLYRDLGVLA